MLSRLLKNIRKKEFPIFILLLTLFFMSDSILRRKVYAPPTNEGEDSQIVEILPEFIRNYFEKLEKKEKVQDKLETEKNVAARRELLFELIELSSESNKEDILRKIISEDPHSIKVHQAWVMLMPYLSADDIMEDYLSYVQNCKYNKLDDKNMIWESGWLRLKHTDASNDQLYRYLLKLLDNRVISAGLKDAYNRCWSIALSKNDNFVVEESLKMKASCHELVLKMKDQVEKEGG